MNLSKRISSLRPSPTLEVAAKAKSLKAEGKDVISLSVGEPDWNTFEPVIRAAAIAMEAGKTKYTPANGILELRQAICRQVSHDLDLNFEPSSVTVSAGGKFVLFSAFQSLLNPGDEVIIPAPYWVSYPDMVELCGGSAKIVSTKSDDDFKITPAQLERAIGERTKIFLLNSPSNPTGLVYSPGELSALAQV